MLEHYCENLPNSDLQESEFRARIAKVGYHKISSKFKILIKSLNVVKIRMIIIPRK